MTDVPKHIDPAEFPGNLRPAELSAVKALLQHGARKRAALRLGISLQTMNDYLKLAFAKAGVHHAVQLAVRYFETGGKLP